ncbi:sporulation-specific diadenylate cyclase CdaS [Oceanobacillus halophilus]|uniref:Diadenylate cyclase n=1 Tax=Oceanobacillus halophilus TaxID=930130 RepID=A0A495A0I7_9BACI|nr:sporulation-specific diadenylate cyclase CdaS [Oceanobacillus halophilus]RKQ32952.1 diadenylate cyclase [Oceanobacillus halophilus]
MTSDPRLSAPIFNHLRGNLEKLSQEIHQMIQSFDIKESGILNEFDEIHHLFHEVQINAASYYLRSYLAPYTNHFSALSTAIQHLSERNHGALIVIERNDELNTFIHSGVLIHANLSSALLESIFYSGNPLHDGAVLIRNHEIISAANILPVSDRKSNVKKLGTRHRAALGISELTDALVLVVSEETGRATFALDGNLYPIMAKGLH